MVSFRGTPLVKLGEAQSDCTGRLVRPPEPCTACRQVARWLERTIGWNNGVITRFKNIVKAILTSHDEILQSLCGSCAQQTGPLSCECFELQYTLLGLPQTVELEPIIPAEDPELVDIDSTCYTVCAVAGCEEVVADGLVCLRITSADDGAAIDWQLECAGTVGVCELITLTPCTDPVHLDMMSRRYNATSMATSLRGTGAGILSTIALLFPDTVPQLVAVTFGNVYVTLGRSLTPTECAFLDYLTAAVPLGFGVKLHFVSPL